MIEFSGRLWAQNIYFENFLCHCFYFLHGPWLFRTCSHTKICSMCKFCLHYNVGCSTILTESLKSRNNSQIAVGSHSNLYEYVKMNFLNIMLFHYFSLGALLQAWFKIANPTTKQIDAEFQEH